MSVCVQSMGLTLPFAFPALLVEYLPSSSAPQDAFLLPPDKITLFLISLSSGTRSIQLG